MAKQPPMQAQDTFVATMPDGSDQLVTKGQVLPFSHPLVQRDRDGSGTLFQPLDLGEEPEEPKSEEEPEEPKSEPEAEAAAPAPVKPATGRAAGKAPSRG